MAFAHDIDGLARLDLPHVEIEHVAQEFAQFGVVARLNQAGKVGRLAETRALGIKPGRWGDRLRRRRNIDETVANLDLDLLQASAAESVAAH